MKKTLSYLLRSSTAVAFGAALWLSATPHVQAKAGAGGPITITAIGTLAAGPDFATDVLADPWDFNNPEDVTSDPAQIDGFSNFAVSGGFAGGTVTTRRDGNNGSSYFTILSRPWNGILNPGRTGRRFPIDSTTYSQLSFKINIADGGQLPRVYWFHNDIGAADSTGWRFVDSTFTLTPQGNNIYSVDLTQLSNGVAWNAAAVTGLALFPNDKGNLGYQVQYDWVRLTTATASPAAAKKTLTWSGSAGPATISVTDAANTTFVVAKNQNSGYVWNYGVLPPGTYTLKISDGTNSGSTPFTINAPPSLQITDPDETGGQDFATTVLGNAWDMNSASDINEDSCCIRDHLSSVQFNAGVLDAVSDGVVIANIGGIPIGDPQVYVLSNPRTSNTTDIIDTTKYHRLTFDLKIDRAFDLQRGSVARVFWGSDSNDSAPGGTPYNVAATKDIITWPGKNVYTLDLATLTTSDIEAGNTTLWTQKPVRHFRIDPFEFGESIPFHIDNVKLAADDETAGGSFTIKFTASDTDGPQAPTVSLFYDTDKNPGNGLTLIASNIAASAGQYVWNTGSVPPGLYYIRAVASDGLNTTGRYSTGPVKVVSFTPPSNGLMTVDSPTNGQVLTSAFEVGGWAIDTGASSGSGVDSIQFYVQPVGTPAPGVFVGTGSVGAPRGDVGGAFGAQFTNSGFHFTITGLGPGNFVLGVYAHSTVTNSFSIVKQVPFSVNANQLMSIDAPSPEATVPAGSTFSVAGWSIDRASSGTSGTGVDALHVYAYPNPGSGTPPIFLGVATLGFSRPDVGSVYGSQYNTSGYQLIVNAASAGMTPGVYNIAVVSHSTSGSFNNLAVVRITVQ